MSDKLRTLKILSPQGHFLAKGIVKIFVSNI